MELMVGRTPEFLGRKVEKRESSFASVVLLVHPFFIINSQCHCLMLQILRGFPDPNSQDYQSWLSRPLSPVVYEYWPANNGSG